MSGMDAWNGPGLVDALELFPELHSMAKTRLPYSPEFRLRMVELVRAGHDPDDLAREFEPTAQSIRNWIGRADKKDGRQADTPSGLIAAECDELSRFRRENKPLRVERDMLPKAAAWFAREGGAATSRQIRRLEGVAQGHDFLGETK